MKEIWKSVGGYDGFYEVSNMGRVKSLNRVIVRSDGIARRVSGRILKPRASNVGYYYVNLLRGSVSTSKTVHRLVAEAFVPNTENKPCIDHINGVRTDNRIENLRWCNYIENQNYPIAISRRNHKGVSQYLSNGDLISNYNSISEAEKATGISHSNIIACCRGRRKDAGGYVWKY